VCPHTTSLGSKGNKERGGGEYKESGDDGDKEGYSSGERNKICTYAIGSVRDLLLSRRLAFQRFWRWSENRMGHGGGRAWGV
jgi:hypothetical protein